MVVGEITSSTDLLVLGGGPGGYTSAIRAAQLGLDVSLVEKDGVGGTCLLHGCVPSKALISASRRASLLESSEEMGIYGEVEVDAGEMYGWKDEVVSGLSGGVQRLCRANDVEVIEGFGEIREDGSVRVERDGDPVYLSYDSLVIATGSSPVEIQGDSFSENRILSSRDALALSEIPGSITVIGGGYIGMELSLVFARLGSEVRVVEALDYVLSEFSEDMARPVKKYAEDMGVEFNIGEEVSGINPGSESVEVVSGDGGKRYTSDYVLVAVGRSPNTSGFGLENLGVEMNGSGFIETDKRMETSVPDVYAVGDVAGEPMLAHKASAQGRVAAENASGGDSVVVYQVIPMAVFTDPEIAMVGLSVEEARERGFDVVVGEFPLHGNARALTLGEPEGFIRLVAEEGTGFVLGGEVVGPEASELIGEIGFAVEMGATVEDLAATVHMHPTLSEGVMEAAENALGRAIHTLNR